MPVEPIGPDDVASQKKSITPDVVIECFNQLIAQNFYGNQSTFKQKEVADLIYHKMSAINPKFDYDVIYTSHWLDVESLYREKGWIVTYDKPGFNESYDATFTFKPARHHSS